ncbi:hypothetical protein BJY04DRAFT_159361 [Aspergillus karnatakaensis]|uniref:uncharacterized protein n=1 Tax=Aspergillus karnatakaensis TaxID=1810916 RepID=UPI003CCDAB35
MWGKVSFHRSRKPSIENPPPIDTQVYQPAPLSVPRSRNLSAKALPTLPTNLTPHQPDSNARVASSIYSRDTVVLDHHRQRSISDTYQLAPRLEPPSSAHGYSQGTRSVDISPPDSPISQIRSRSSSRVSPIEDEDIQTVGPGATGHLDSKFASNIPVYRKRVDSQPERPQPTPPAPRTNATRWDDYSGEPTRSNQGRIGQVTPSNVSFQTHVSAAPSSTPSHNSKLFGWGKEQFHSKKKVPEIRDRYYPVNEATLSSPREPWRGQSGRAPMVAPIQEKPRNRSSSRLQSSRSNDRFGEMNTLASVAGIMMPSTITTITAGEANRKPEHRKRPHDGREAHAVATRKTSAVSGSAPPRVDLVSGPSLSDSLTDLRLAGEDDNEPKSRFSVTTYNPTEPGSRASSPQRSITPSPPASIIETASQSSDTARSIMSRSRPVPSTIVLNKRPIRKPTPSEIPSNKALPPNPAEMTAQGRIEMLEAKRNDLGRRRTNIDTIIHELTQVIQPSSIAYDMAAREEVKKTVASLNNELAEIKREEHEIGLKLVRAWKKREDEDFYGQGGSLWVQRVTS